MRIIALRTLREFWQSHPDAEQALRAWYTNAKRASWKSPANVKASYRNASILPSNRVVFNIKDNDYRLVVMIDYTYGLIFMRFIGTHRDCNRIDATSI